MGSLLGGEGSLPGSCSLAFAVAVVDGGGARAGRREEGKRAGQRPDRKNQNYKRLWRRYGLQKKLMKAMSLSHHTAAQRFLVAGSYLAGQLAT